jgi:hypothetical protein
VAERATISSWARGPSGTTIRPSPSRYRPERGAPARRRRRGAAHDRQAVCWRPGVGAQRPSIERSAPLVTKAADPFIRTYRGPGAPGGNGDKT